MIINSLYIELGGSVISVSDDKCWSFGVELIYLSLYKCIVIIYFLLSLFFSVPGIANLVLGEPGAIPPTFPCKKTKMVNSSLMNLTLTFI